MKLSQNMSAADNKIWFQIHVLLQFYAAWNGSLLPTFQVNLSVPYSRVQKSKKKARNIWLHCVKTQNTSYLCHGRNLTLDNKIWLLSIYACVLWWLIMILGKCRYLVYLFQCKIIHHKLQSLTIQAVWRKNITYSNRRWVPTLNEKTRFLLYLQVCRYCKYLSQGK